MPIGRSGDLLYCIRFPLLVALALTAACAPKGDALYARAEKSLASGNVRAAVIDLQNLVKDEPGNAKARALLGLAFVRAGDVGPASIEIQKARELGAGPDMILVPDCTVLAAKGEFSEVLARCNPALVQGDARVQLQVVQGQALLGLKRAAEAKTKFEVALSAQPDNLSALVGLAAAVYETDGLQAARAVLDKAPESIRGRPAYWMAVGGIAVQGGDLAAAEIAYQTAAEKVGEDKDSVERLMALGALAETQMRQGKTEVAKVTSAELKKLAPTNPRVKQLRGQIAAAGGDFAEARTLLEEVVAAQPDNYEARLLLGTVNLQQGNLGQAEMHFTNVVANQPDNARARRLLAETQARSQSPEATLEGMKGSLEMASADPSLLVMASRLSLASGNRDQALSYLAQASSQPAQGQAPDVQLEVASGYIMAGDLDHAIEILESMPQGGASGYQREYLLMAALLRKGEKDKALAEARALVERSGNDPVVRNLVAAVFSAAGQPGAGREQFAEALKLKPNDPQTLINIGRLDLAEGKAADADKTFRKVLESDPKNLVATLGLAAAAGSQGNAKEAEKWLQKAAADHPESVEAQLALAQFYLGSGEFRKALTVTDTAAKAAPKSAAVSNARGFAQLGLKEMPEAIASFKQATELEPKAYGYSLNLARAHFLNQDVTSSLDVLNGLLKAEPGFLPALALAAAVSLKAGDVEKAAGYVARLKQAAPEAPGTYALEGDLAMAQKRYGDALVAYRKASANAGSRELALAEYRAGLLAKAPRPEKPLEDWVGLHPDDAEVVAALAEVKQSKGDADGAIRLYEQGLEKVPGNPVLLNNLAVLYQARGDSRALGLAERAYNAAPKSAAIQDTYGWLLFENGKYEKALELLSAASKSLPGSAEVRYHYAAALAKSGKTSDAILLLKDALNGELPAVARADAKKLLDQLSK